MRKRHGILINILSLLLIIDALILLIILNTFQDSDSIDYDNIGDSYNEIDYSQKKDYKDIQETYNEVDYYPRVGYNYDYNSLDYSDYLSCSEFLEYSGYSDYDEGDYCDYYDYKKKIRKTYDNRDYYQEASFICSHNYYDCEDFSTHAEAQTVFEFCGGILDDVHWLDGDDDGRACELLP